MSPCKKQILNFDISKYMSRRKKTYLLVTALLILVMLIPAGSAISIQKFSIDSGTYVPGEAISVSGEILDGNASGEINITIWPKGLELTGQANLTLNKTVFAANGIFSTTIQAPGSAGEFTIIAEAVESGTLSPYLHFDVLGSGDPCYTKMLFTQGDVFAVPLSGSHGITGPLNTSKTGGNFSFDSKTYYFLVSDDDVAYMDDDSDMDLGSDSSGAAVIGNLVEGSKIKLNTTTFTIIHIHNDTEIVLARPVRPAFDGGESANVTVLVLNATGNPLNTNITLDFIKDDGTLVSNTTLDTDANGLATTTISIPTDSGVYHLIAGKVGHISFMVSTVDMFGDILSEENEPKHTFAQGEKLVTSVYLKNKTSGEPLSGAAVTARISSASGTSPAVDLTLSYDSTIGAYTYTYTIPNNVPIDTYEVEYTASLGSQTLKAFTGYEIKAYDLFLQAVSKENSESDGFAPGDEGFLLLAGTNLSNGERLDIEGLTALDKSMFRVNITGFTGNDVTTNWSVMNLTTYYTSHSVPSGVREGIKKSLGDNVTVINFTAPLSNGIYEIHVEVNLSDWAGTGTTIAVQDLFVHGEPVNKQGWHNPTVAPGASARLMIMAFDPSTGEMLPASDIHDAGLVEVWNEGSDDIVTQYMENTTLETINDPFMGAMKVLKFKVNDSQLGFHHVVFWVNATVDGTPKTVMGSGWFDEKLYKIHVKPALDEGTDMFRAFGSDDPIELEVSVKDVSGNSVENAAIEIESVNYGMMGENIPFNVDTSTSYTTNSNGTVTIQFTATDSLKSGFYDVRVKMTTQDGVTDYGSGWFEVSNFIFYAYSTSWDAGIDASINFTLNAFSSNFTNKNVSVTLTRIISMGDWEMLTPSTVYNETNIDVGYINGTGYYNHPGISKGGDYEFVFEASDGTSTEVARAWVHVTPFIAWVDTYGQWEYSTTGFMNFTVEATEDRLWGDVPHNITNVTVEKAMQDGMWMTTYLNRTELAAITTTQKVGGTDNQINVSVNTTGWNQGFYSIVMKVTDNQSNEVYIHHWFQLKLASVTVPELMMVTVNGGQYYTSKTSINATTDIMSRQSQFASLGNVTAGKVSGPVVGDLPITMLEGENMHGILDMGNSSQVPYFAMVVVDSVQKTVYIEYMNQTAEGMQFFNLSDNITTQVFNASVGDTFTDYTGRTWNITQITNDGTVKLEGVNALRNGLILDGSVMSLSKSGKFLMGSIWDEEWMQLDLDGDGEYYGDDRYALLLIDANEPGKYDTVYVSDTANFSAGTYIDASAGTPVQFGGSPTYLLSKKYQSGAYILEFTSYQKGWPGMYLGTYANGSVLKIPFLVTTPDGTPIMNSKVTIDFLMDQGRDTYPLTGINNTTDASGLTIISINTSQHPIQTGEWMIHYNATIGSEYAVADEEMFWEMPRFELRNFMVSGSLGIPGSIQLIQLKDANITDGLPGNNMLLEYGDEIEFKRGIGLRNYYNNTYQLEYPFDNWYYNATTNEFNYSTDGGATMQPGKGYLINSSSAMNILDYNVTWINTTGDIIVLTPGINILYENMWIFNVTDINGTNATIDMSYKGWPWTMPGLPGSKPETEIFTPGDSWWMGGLDFNVVSVNDTNSTVVLRLNAPVIVASVDPARQLMDNNSANGEIDRLRGSVNTVTFNGLQYRVYGYEDKANTSADVVEWGWIDTMDRVLVENLSSGQSRVVKIGESIPEFNGYYVASVPDWGGKLVLLNSSVTHVYPIPDWGADEPIYYVGNFSDADLGVDLPTLGKGGPDVPRGNITSDDRYSILMFDTQPNGMNEPNQAIYDDDPDLVELADWETFPVEYYDLYGIESGYQDAIAEMFDPDNIMYTNMSEQFAWDIGTGNMNSWPLAIPVVKINDTDQTATAKTFAPMFDFDKNENATIYVSARNFDGTVVNGTVELVTLKMSFGGRQEVGFFEDLPREWNMTFANINATLVEGEASLKITPDDLPADLQPGGSHEFDFAEFTAVVEVTKNSQVETLKINFFSMDYAKATSGSAGGGS